MRFFLRSIFSVYPRRVAGARGVLAEQFVGEVGALLSPEGLVVVYVVAPVVEPGVVDAFFLEYAVHFAGAP